MEHLPFVVFGAAAAPVSISIDFIPLLPMSSNALSASAAGAALPSERGAAAAASACSHDDEKKPGGGGGDSGGASTDTCATAGGPNAAFVAPRRDPGTRLEDLIVLFYAAAEENSMSQRRVFILKSASFSKLRGIARYLGF